MGDGFGFEFLGFEVCFSCCFFRSDWYGIYFVSGILASMVKIPIIF